MNSTQWGIVGGFMGVMGLFTMPPPVQPFPIYQDASGSTLYVMTREGDATASYLAFRADEECPTCANVWAVKAMNSDGQLVTVFRTGEYVDLPVEAGENIAIWPTGQIDGPDCISLDVECVGGS